MEIDGAAPALRRTELDTRGRTGNAASPARSVVQATTRASSGVESAAGAGIDNAALAVPPRGRSPRVGSVEHREAARVAESVQNRMTAAHAKGLPEGDVLLAMVDYNEAMEGAPEAVPGVFKSMESRLNQRWAEYKADRDQARAGPGGQP